MRLFEAEFDGRLDILTPHGKACASAAAASTAKQRLKKVAEATRATSSPEEVPPVANIHASAFSARRRGESSASLPVLAELVVALTLLRIREDLIGLPNIFEFLFGAAVTGVDVRMILTRQLAVGFLDVFRSRARRYWGRGRL
jgi:hypothetical protein